MENTDVVGGNADVTWFPRHFKQRGVSRQRRHSASPLLRLGRARKGIGSGRLWVTQRNATIRSTPG